MNRALERGPLSVARSGLCRRRVGTVDGDAQVSWQHDERILSRLSRRDSNGACTTSSPSCLRWSIHCPPALKDQLDPERACLPAWENHEFSSRGFPDWRAERTERLGSMRKLS